MNTRHIFVPALCAALALPSAGQAQGLFERIGKTADDAADAVVDTGKKVGSAVEQSVTSTEDLVTNEDTPDETRAELDAMEQATLNRLFGEVAGSQGLFDESAGYAVFDTRRVTVFPLTAGYGRGVAIDRATDERVYMQMGTGGLGAALGVGGFEAQMVMLFETHERYSSFVRNGYDASAEAQMKIDKDVTEEALNFVDGRQVFVLGTRGWRVAASVGGTRYWRDGALN